jgi:hypothetical protein
MTDIRNDKNESKLPLWKQRIAEWRRLSPRSSNEEDWKPLSGITSS